jgi:hypothetical protein
VTTAFRKRKADLQQSRVRADKTADAGSFFRVAYSVSLERGFESFEQKVKVVKRTNLKIEDKAQKIVETSLLYFLHPPFLCKSFTRDFPLQIFLFCRVATPPVLPQEALPHTMVSAVRPMRTCLLPGGYNVIVFQIGFKLRGVQF